MHCGELDGMPPLEHVMATVIYEKSKTPHAQALLFINTGRNINACTDETRKSMLSKMVL